MNELIKKLANRCNFTDQNINDMSPGLAQFAELIVQECIDIADNVAQLDNDKCCTTTAVKIANKIEKLLRVHNAQKQLPAEA